MISKSSDSVAVGDTGKEPSPVKDEPYIYVPPSRMGAFGKYVVNVPYYRNWLNNTVSWKVQKSVDGSKWVDYEKFVVKKDWNSETLSEKHTIIVDADEDAFYRILTNTNADKQLVSFEDKSSVTLYELSFRVSEDKSYTLFYNWSDYSKSAEASKTSLSKGVKTDSLSAKQYFEWAVTSSVKLKAGEQFVLDPVYGTIGDAVTDSWEYDNAESRHQNTHFIERLGTSDYYLVGATGDTGTDMDGFLRVLHIWDNNGTIHEAIIDSWEFDTDNSYYIGVYHISGDVYAVYYHDIGSAKGVLFTTTVWSSNGTMKKDYIDTFQCPLNAIHLYPTLIHVTDSVYAMIYTESTTYDQQLETINISSAGVIDNTHADIIEIDATSTETTRNMIHGCMVDSDTIAVVWQVGKSFDYDTWIATYNISNTGNIGATYADCYEFDTRGTSSSSAYCYIHKVSVNTFAVAYTSTSDYVKLITFNITDTGNILGIIDSLSFDGNTIGSYFMMFTVNDASTMVDGKGVYGIAWAKNSNLWRVITVNISYGGIIPATINDGLSLNSYDATILASPQCVHMDGNYYLLINTDNSADGWVYTFEIETYQAPASWSNVCPIAKGEHPTNSSTGVVLKPAVGCTITDSNSNHTMNVTFATNSSGTWRNFQTNSSVANNSKVNWTMSMAGTGNAGYSWRVYVHDGICNASFTFKFKTASNVTPPVNHDPSVTTAFPTDDATGISVNVNRHNITVSDPDGDLMNYSYHYFIEGCNLAGDNEGAVGNGTYSLILNDGVCCPLEYDTVYTWWVNVSDGNGGWDNDTFSFTTESPEQRTPTNIFDYYFVCGNETSRTPANIFDHWFLCGNETTRSPTNVFDYYFQCGNTTSRISTNVYDYYFLCGNTSSRSPTEIFDHWFLCGNETSRTPTESFDYYFVCGNGTTRVATEVFDYWFLCGNETSRNPLQIFDYYFQCGNTTSRIQTDIFDYYFECGNMTSRNPAQVFDYYFICGNTSSRSPTEIFDHWFLCGNETTRTPTSIFDSWFLCGNGTGRTSVNVLDYYFLCGNETTRDPAEVFDSWFLCGNNTVRTSVEVFDYFFVCGNETSRTPANIFDHWFLCGNTTTRNPANIFDYWFQCGNTSSRTSTSIFDSWFLCGNISGRTPTNVLDHWFLCGNGSGRSETQIFDYYFICGNNTQRNPTEIFDHWFLCGNGTGRNPTEIFDHWFLCGNGTGRNPTEIFDYYFLCGNKSLNIHILLSNPVPTITTTLSINKNNITNHTGDLQISITRNHTHGWNMSTSIWFNNTFLFTNTSLGNGTITFWLFDYYNNPIISGVDYNWTVNCTNGTTYTNQTYTFRIRVQKGTTSILPIKERDLPLSLVIGAILSLLMSLIWKRKKRKRRRPVIIGQPTQQQYSRGTPRR